MTPADEQDRAQVAGLAEQDLHRIFLNNPIFADIIYFSGS
jgi:hypothetical protein